MRFTQILSVLALATSGFAKDPMTADQVVSNINQVTNLSNDTNNIAMTISPFNVFITGPQIVSNFQEIVTIATDDISVMGGGSKRSAKIRQAPSPYEEEDQLAICDAFRSFVKVHQALLATVIGKRGFFSRTPFTKPIAAVLVKVEKVVDTLAFGIIDLVPTCADGAKEDKDSLDKSLQDAIDAYD